MTSNLAGIDRESRTNRKVDRRTNAGTSLALLVQQRLEEAQRFTLLFDDQDRDR